MKKSYIPPILILEKILLPSLLQTSKVIAKATSS